jgi:hypothetical protein
MRAFPAADDNDALPLPAERIRPIIYLLSDASTENGEIFDSAARAAARGAISDE